MSDGAPTLETLLRALALAQIDDVEITMRRLRIGLLAKMKGTIAINRLRKIIKEFTAVQPEVPPEGHMAVHPPTGDRGNGDGLGSWPDSTPNHPGRQEAERIEAQRLEPQAKVLPLRRFALTRKPDPKGAA